MALICKQNLNALMFFLLNEVNVSFHLNGNNCTKQATSLFCYNSYQLAIKKKALEITRWEGCQDGGSCYIDDAEVPKSNY